MGHTVVACHVVDCDALLAEHDENELREPFRVSERIAIALMEQLRGRAGESRDLAAKKAGFGSGRTRERARKVLKDGAPEIAAAMDRGGGRFDGKPKWWAGWWAADPINEKTLSESIT
jgi:hypothetical protein